MHTRMSFGAFSPFLFGFTGVVWLLHVLFGPPQFGRGLFTRALPHTEVPAT